MRRLYLLLGVLLAVVPLLSGRGLVSAAPTNAPSPCFIELPKLYLVVDGVRRHIADWDTFLNLGYTQTDIVPCDTAAAAYPEGDPVTRLFKGSTDPVYWLENGLRRHIPDMATFAALGFKTSDITVLPDDVLALWSLGTPLDSVLETPTPVPANAGIAYHTVGIGQYTIRLWHPSAGLGDFATISQVGQLDVTINDVASLGQLPASDILNDGNPDVLFLTNPGHGSHCCSGTVLYDLGTVPRLVLDIQSSGDQLSSTGRGSFKDINGDHRYEFIIDDPLNNIPCSQPTVTAVLRYNPATGTFVGDSPKFASYYADQLTQLRAQASAAAGTGNAFCATYPLVAMLIYTGQIDQAQAAFTQYYSGTDSALRWPLLLAAVQDGHYYVAAGT